MDLVYLWAFEMKIYDSCYYLNNHMTQIIIFSHFIIN